MKNLLFNICRTILCFNFLLFAGFQISLNSAELKFNGNNHQVVSIKPEANTGLEQIYVLYDMDGVEISYNSASLTSDVKWCRFSNMGGGFSEELTDVVFDGRVSTISGVSGDMGYIVEENGRNYCFWIVDYSKHYLHLNSVESVSGDCDFNKISVRGSGEAIHYYTINGQQRTLSREINVNYSTLQWDENSEQWQKVVINKLYDNFLSDFNISPAAYCNTKFIISGDKFLKSWNLEETIESETFTANAVACATTAVQEGEIKDSLTQRQSRRRQTENDGLTNNEDSPNDDSTGEESDDEKDDLSNILPAENSGLGGNAPAEINFYGYVTDAVMHPEWQLSRDSEFNEVELRFNQQDLNYTFTEEGTFYLRFVVNNADGTCEAVSDIYTVSIGASELLCPNAFSPNGDGVNDIWKVAYRSLLDFECWIFDRYGTQVFHYTDPSSGWDGIIKGKTAKSGVYYYVIKATGADGKKYKKSGDINIINYRRNTTTQPQE